MDLQELLDREEIRGLQSAYNIAGDRGRPEEAAQVFAPDGVLHSRRGSGVGPEAIAVLLGARPGDAPGNGPDRPMAFVRHHVTTSQVTFNSPTDARGRTYFVVFTEVGPDHMGVYVDRYRKVDGAWKIAERQPRIDWVAENGHTVASRG